jgi:hypothetical protein
MDNVEIATISTKIDLMSVQLDDLDVKVERMDEAIRGNGHGLITRMALLSKRVDLSEAFITEFQAIRKWVVLGILGVFGTMAWNVFEWYIQTNA